MFNDVHDIYETRQRKDNGDYRIQLTIPEKTYHQTYSDNYNLTIASDILTRYLENRGDDGKPVDVQIRENKNRHTVEIEADLSYIKNEHTDYAREYGHFFKDIMNAKDHDITYDQKNNQ